MLRATTKPIAMLFNGVWSQYAVATAPKYREFFDLLYVHDIEDGQLPHYKALLIPFQNNHLAIAEHRGALYEFLGTGKKIAVFGDAGHWIDARWEERPVDNYWWVDHPNIPTVANTCFDHLLFSGLTPRQACWHHHGVYTQIPDSARVLQRTNAGEVISWSTVAYGGELLAATQDPIVEHGVQQIQHLDHFVDQLVYWLCGQRPPCGRMQFDRGDYGRPWSKLPHEIRRTQL